MALQKALVEFEDFEDVNAAQIAAREQAAVEGEEREEFEDKVPDVEDAGRTPAVEEVNLVEVDEAADEEGGTVTDYMLHLVHSDLEYFRSRDWKIS